jgi:hypothetical protein
VTDTLADALPREIARVRDQVLPNYLALRCMPNVMVEPAIMMMRTAMDAASKAMIEGDIAAMLRALEDLKGFEK